jgi:ElaB/YqjD/DUF883 family membrane-anchored ribosome-binding protein
MADRNDANSRMSDQNRAAGWGNSTTEVAGQRAGSVVAEFADAARSAAESLLQEQKQQVAERVAGVAEALWSAFHPLHRSQNRMIARYIGQAADQVESFSRKISERRWNELVAETEDFARRQPTLFVLGAVATGFLVGRLLWTSAGAPRRVNGTSRAGPRSEPARAVTAAVSSASGAGTGASRGADTPVSLGSNDAL